LHKILQSLSKEIADPASASEGVFI
jgi:hypothetical protein